MPDQPDNRFIRDQSNGAVYDTAGGFLDYIPSAEEFKARSGSSDIVPNTLAVDNPQDYLRQKFTRQASNQFLPQQDLALQGLQQAGIGLDQNTSDVNRQYDTLGQQLSEAAKAATGTMQEQQNNFGMLSSGMTQAGLGKIQSDLSKNQGNAAQDRASQLAQIALQRAGLATKTADVKLQTSQSINDMVNQLLSGSSQAQKEAFAQKLQLQQVAGTIPVGQSVNIQGNVIHGTMQPKLTQIDLGNKVVSVDEKGNIVNSYSKGLTPSSASFGSTGGTSADLYGDIQGAIPSITNQAAPGASGSREGLITALINKYASSKTITPMEIASAVYSSIRQPGESPFNGLPQSAIDFVNRVSGKPASAESSKDQQVQTNIDVANQALQNLKSASANLNTASSRASGGYLTQTVRNKQGEISGNNADVTTMNLKGAAILTAIRALTNTGRVTESEINDLQLPTIYDTKTEANTKIANLQSLLDRARGGSGGMQQGPPAPSSGLSTIWGF